MCAPWKRSCSGGRDGEPRASVSSGFRFALTHTVVAAALAAGAVAAHAQLPASSRWNTIQSANFRITYEPRLEELARHAAASAERAHTALRVMVADAPSGTIDIVLADNVDFSNGYATPFPSNRVVVFVKPPVDALELQYTRDWVEIVIVHELAHIFHLDVTSGFGRLVRAIFGRIPAPWPVFPAVATPGWSVEGLAVGVESNVAGFGRLHGSYQEMVVRTAVLEDEIDDMHRLSSSTPVWPGGSRIYIYGGLFFDYLTRRFGPDASVRIVRATAGALVPPPLWFSDVGRRALGMSFRQAYEDWERELEERYASLSAQLTAAGLTTTERLTQHGRFAMYPRFSPDARRIAYASSDGRTVARTAIIDAQTAAVEWTRNRNDLAPASWLLDETLVTADLQFTDRFHIYSDLYTLRSGDRSRLTHGARLQEPDAARDGRRVVAVENLAGTNRLVLVDPATGAQRPITAFEPNIHWALPRWSPDGSRIAAGRWQTGGRYDIVVVDTLGVVQREITDGVGVNASPAWSPDGRWLLFSSDRTGISNLYAADITLLGNNGASAASPARLRQITNVLTGAFYPDVSPDGRSIVFSMYHHDGFALERIPFDTAQWREPQPAQLTELPTQRPHYPTQIRADEFSASISDAVARVDTIAGPPRRYRPLRHLRPYSWGPVFDSQADDNYFGAFTYGSDLVERHFWDASFAVAPVSGRTVGALSYVYRGLPPIRALGVHPTISAVVDRYWDELLEIDSLDFRLDEREDRAAVGVGLTHVRWRMNTGLSVSGEYVRRVRHAVNLPANLRLDRTDDLLGVRATTSFQAFATPAFAISRENGVVLQLSARQRWELHPTEVQTSTGTRVFDSGYREWSTWDAGYVALPFGGFARHVLGARFSALSRSGLGASTTAIGGASGEGVGLSSFLDEVGGSSRFLPVRGFPSGTRRGTRAWTASTEYRFPLALVTRALAPLPLFLDRLAGSLFADAGHAWCPAPLPCQFNSASDPPLLSAGAELTGIFSLWGGSLPVRLGLGIPLQGSTSKPRLHLVTGAAF
jgi:hypothetical protein